MADPPYQLAIIIGSIREGRFGPVVADWFISYAERRGDSIIDVIDLGSTPLPPRGQARPVSLGVYDAPEVREFAGRIGAADAFVVVTPEYNHGYPGPLKVAIDSVYQEWHAKPVAFVSYGGISGGLRAVEHLRAVFGELHAVTIRETVSFHWAQRQFDADGAPCDAPVVEQAAKALLDQLAWWANVLRAGRAVRPYGA